MLTRWQPFSELSSELSRVQSELNRLFNRTTSRTGLGFPAINIWQDENQMLLEAELPGMKLEDLEIYVDGDNRLTIKGHRKFADLKSGTWHRRERMNGEFRRTIELPQQVDPNKVEASLKNGILTVNLPKRDEVKPRKIEVRAN